jgi:TRAP-type C4-dicarboxylate transport system substrate-binding protein
MGLGVGAAAAALSAPTFAQQQIKLTLADQNSPSSWYNTRALTPWVKQVEEATKGRVKIEIYPSQTLEAASPIWAGASTATGPK